MNDQASAYRKKTLDASFNGAFLDYMTKTLYQNEQYFNETPLKICKETVMPSFVVAYMRKNHFLVHQINRKIELFQSNGILVHWIHRFTKFKHGHMIKSTSSRPVATKMKNIRGAFDILLYGLLISLLCFLFEIAINQIRRRIGSSTERYTLSILMVLL